MSQEPPFEWPEGARWPDLSPKQRRAHFARQLEAPIAPYWKRVLLAAIEHGCGWAKAMEVVDSESQRLNRRGRS